MTENLLPSFEPTASVRPAKADSSPYASLPPERFWRTGVAETNPLIMEKLYTKRFDIAPTDRIATAGSCFAQHIARNFRARGFTVMDVEPTPEATPPGVAQAYGYGVYSARYANIYTVRHSWSCSARPRRRTAARHPGRCWSGRRRAASMTGCAPASSPRGCARPRR